MIDWKRKLTSRKLWAAIAGFVSGLIVAFGATEAIATQVTGLILSAGSIVAYILGESQIDAANAGNASAASGDAEPDIDKEEEAEG